MKLIERGRLKRLQKKKAVIKCFTIIELITAMAVFSIIMLVMIKMLGAAQEAWLRSDERNQLYENANIAMELMTRQLQSAQYDNGTYAFWHWRDPHPEHQQPESKDLIWGYTSQLRGEKQIFGFYEALAFVSSTNTSNDVDSRSQSNLCEVMYTVSWDFWNKPRWLGFSKGVRSYIDGYLWVSITNASTMTNYRVEKEPGPTPPDLYVPQEWRPDTLIIDPRYNPTNNFLVATADNDDNLYKASPAKRIMDSVDNIDYWGYDNDAKVGQKVPLYEPKPVFTLYADALTNGDITESKNKQTPTSSNLWSQLVPAVTELEFTCYDDNGSIIPPDTSLVSSPYDCRDLDGNGIVSPAEKSNYFPAYVKIKISMMSIDGYAQWAQLAGDQVTPPYEKAQYESSPNGTNPAGNTWALSYKYRLHHQRTFTRLVVLRGRIAE